MRLNQLIEEDNKAFLRTIASTFGVNYDEATTLDLLDAINDSRVAAENCVWNHQ